MGELYLSSDRIRFEKANTTIFESTPEDIKTVVYNKRSIKFVLKSGQSYVLRYLHLGVEKEGFAGYWAFYSVMYNDPDAAKSLYEKFRQMNINVIEGSTGKESPYFYFAIACAMFAFSFIGVMAIAKFIFGMETFLGINL